VKHDPSPDDVLVYAGSIALDGTDHESHRAPARVIRRDIHMQDRNAHDKTVCRPGQEAVPAVEEAAANLAGVVRALQTALDELRTEREAHEATRRELAQVRGELEGMASNLARARHWRELLDRLLTGPETAGD
jgi:hypothetical protein